MIDEILTGKGLAKEVQKLPAKQTDDSEMENGDGEAEQGTRYDYVDKARVGDIHVARVIVDGRGKVIHLGADFRSDEREFSYGYYKVSRFVADVWVRAAGAPPVFAIANSKAGLIGKEMLEATFETARLRGRWIKHVVAAGMRDKVIDQVNLRVK